MPNLPSFEQCCGCAACIDACPKQAISLQEDKNGLFYPKIDSQKCIDCKQCEKKCHILQTQYVHHQNNPVEIRTYAGWSENEEIIKKSASGGIFAQLAFNFLCDNNSYVYGATLLPNNKVEHIEICRQEDIYLLQGSKYQQTNACGIYKKVQTRLKSKAKVLFSGLPCQIAALYTYLGKEGQTDNLYTIEVICHGVPTNELYKTALILNKAQKVLSYRHKHNGWGPSGNHVTYLKQNGEIFTPTTFLSDFLFRSYLTMNFLRPNCYNCHYANIRRVADLTIGDFWGLENSSRYAEYRNSLGTSLILSNSSQGNHLLESYKDKIHLVNTEWQDFLFINQNLYIPTNQYDYQGYRYVFLIRKLPLFLQKIIYQNGFSFRILYAFQYKINKLFFSRKRRKREQIRKTKYEDIIKHL